MPQINIEININDKSIIQNIMIPYFIKQAEYNISFKLKELDAKLEAIQQEKKYPECRIKLLVPKASAM